MMPDLVLSATSAPPLTRLYRAFSSETLRRQPALTQGRLHTLRSSTTTHVLVTANRARLAAVLQKGLHYQGWSTSVATTPHDLLTVLRQTRVDLVLIDADHFQTDTAALVKAIDPRRSQAILLAADYRVQGQDLRDLATPDNIVIKPFSTQQLMTTLRRKRAEQRLKEF